MNRLVLFLRKIAWIKLSAMVVPSVILAGCASGNAVSGGDSQGSKITNDLDQIIEFSAPKGLTVAAAAKQILEGTEYVLFLSCDTCPAEAKDIASQLAAPYNIKPQFITRKRALLLIGGPRVKLLIDNSNHRISFGYLRADQ